MEEHIEEIDQGHIPVTAPSGAVYHVLTEEEKIYYEDIVTRYRADNSFSNVSDLQDLDRVLMMELMVYRWSLWITREVDYNGMPISIDETNRSIKDFSVEIRQLKKALGIDKAARDKEKGESVQDYIENLKIRAKKFGIVRNKQASKAIELFQDLTALINFHDNCTEQERKENDVEIIDIINWIRDTAIPEFQSIDEEFRKTDQTYWIREQ